jgi:hypothetical protein
MGIVFPFLQKQVSFIRKFLTTYPAHTFLLDRLLVLNKNHKLQVLRVYNMFVLTRCNQILIAEYFKVAFYQMR